MDGRVESTPEKLIEIKETTMIRHFFRRYRPAEAFDTKDFFWLALLMRLG